MKIVWITTSLSTGGAEMMLLKLLQQLDRDRYQPCVISLRGKDEVGAHIEALGIPVFALHMRLGLSALQSFFRLVSYLRSAQPDLVQTWMYHADMLGGFAARLAGCQRIVWGIRNSTLDKRLTKPATLLIVKACALLSRWLPTRIITCSTRAKEVHVRAGYCAKKIQVIPNGFDLKRFAPDVTAPSRMRTALGLPENTPLVGLMARYNPQKNHAGFVEAAKHVCSSMPHVHFILAGGMIDANNNELKKLIQAKALGRNMHLLGRRDDMPELIAALDVLVSSSSFGEAFPNVLGEAMACGVPCAVTDVGDSAEIVDETGFVVAAGDMQGLAQCILKLLSLNSEDKASLGFQARARVESKYEIGRVTRMYESFYDQIVGSKSKVNS